MQYLSASTPARAFLALGSLAGFLGVALGAFGAHALKTRLTPDLLAIFETGVRYQVYHALALILVALGLQLWGSSRSLIWAGWLFASGLLIFSGSLYLLCFSGVRAWGAVTPLGGLCLLAGWLALFLSAWQKTETEHPKNSL